MKNTVAIIVSLVCVYVQALPISDGGTNNARGIDISSGATGFLEDVTSDINDLLGSLEGRLGARSKRSLLDDLLKTKPDAAGLLTGLSSAADVKTVLDSAGLEVGDRRVNSLLGELGGKDINEVVDDAYDYLMARSLDEDCEDATDLSDGEGTTSASESEDGSTTDATSGAVDDAETPASDDSDIGSLIDGSSLTANDIENGVSVEGADQTDLGRRTIAPSARALLGGIVSPVVATGSILGDSVSRLEDVVVA